jgi:hypothetical protein
VTGRRSRWDEMPPRRSPLL